MESGHLLSRRETGIALHIESLLLIRCVVLVTANILPRRRSVGDGPDGLGPRQDSALLECVGVGQTAVEGEEFGWRRHVVFGWTREGWWGG